MEEEKNPSLKQYESLEEIRKNVLTEDEKIILNLKLEGKTDSQIAAILGVTTAAIGQKKRNLYKLIESLVWWNQNEDRILTGISTNLAADAVPILTMIALRKRQNEISLTTGITLWRINKILGTIFEVCGREPEFRAFFENLRLGYKVPWKHTPLSMPPQSPALPPTPPVFESEKSVPH